MALVVKIDGAGGDGEGGRDGVGDGGSGGGDGTGGEEEK